MTRITFSRMLARVFIAALLLSCTTSLLPFGELEEFVYSNDRRNLLLKWNADSDVSFDDHIYYKLLQIENELGFNHNIDIDSLQNEFEDTIELVHKQYPNARAMQIPNKIKDLILRNEFRQIFDYNRYDNNTIHRLMDALQTQLKIRFDEYKIEPHDPSKGIHTRQHNTTSCASHVEQRVILNKLNHSFYTSVANGAYESTLIPWILRTHNDSVTLHHLFTHHPSKMIMFTDTIHHVMMHTANATLQYSSFLKSLPLEQIQELMRDCKDKPQQYTFVLYNTYVDKLMPIELSLYEHQSWTDHERVPIHLKWQYMQILYQNIGKIRDMECLVLPILYQHIVLMQRNYYVLGLSYPYNLDIMMQYIQLYEQYNQSCTLSLQHRFWNVPPHTAATSRDVLQGFVEFLNTRRGKLYFMNNLSMDNTINITRHLMNYSVFSTEMLRSTEARVAAREGAPATKIKHDLLHDRDSMTHIQFDPIKNPTFFGLNETRIEVFVNVVNVNDIVVKWFQINTKSYFRDHKEPISSGLNLDGLSASYEWIVKQQDIGLRTTYHEKQIAIPFPKAWLHKRGVFLLDLLSNGVHARAVITVGCIKYVTTLCEAGHYTSHKHTILIPFTNQPNPTQPIILQREDDPLFNVLSTLDHQSESYVLECGFYIDREQILSQRTAVVMVHCALFLNSKQDRISVAVLQNIKLSIQLHTANEDDIDNHKAYDDFKLFDDKESNIILQIPNAIRTITVSLDAQIHKISSAHNVQSFHQTQTFHINSMEDTFNLAQLLLIPQVDDAYRIALYGRNGEAIANQELIVYLYPYHVDAVVTVMGVCTDEYGHAYLPNLDNRFVTLTARVQGTIGLEHTWDLQQNRDFYPPISQVIYAIAHKTIRIPYIPKQRHAHVALFDWFYSTKYDERYVKYDAQTSNIIISNLPPAKYILKILDLDYDVCIHVVQKGIIHRMDQHIVNVYQHQITALTPTHPLQIYRIEMDDEDRTLRIQLNGSNPRTRVHVIATHLYPAFDVSQLLCKDIQSKKMNSHAHAFANTNKNLYLKQRAIDEEYRYVLEREYVAVLSGNALPKPSLLVKPLMTSDTITHTQTAEEGTDFEDLIDITNVHYVDIDSLHYSHTNCRRRH
eukprot:1063160_1